MSHWGRLCASNVIIFILLNEFKHIDNINKYMISNSPLNNDIISILYGSLLGNNNAEKKDNKTRFIFYFKGAHKDYIYYLYNIISNLGYCSMNKPKLKTILDKGGKLKKVIRFNTWYLSQFNWIYDNWYINNNKILPKNIDQYLTPLTLAIWIMDNSIKNKNGLKINMNHFTYNECKILQNILINKYNIEIIIMINYIFIPNQSISLLYSIIKPYIISSMKFKFY